MTRDWYRELFRLQSSRMSTLIIVRVGIAVGVPLFAFVAAGHPLAAVAASATAMFVTMSDIGVTRATRVGTMAAAAAAILFGGFVGDRFGGTMYADEFFILASTFVAGWVANSQPGISAVARFGALATAAGAGMQVHDSMAAIAVLAGGASAIVAAYSMWLIHDIPPDQDYIDWRIGIRRAFAGADTGLWFAFCYAGACALSLFAAEQLRLNSPYWATFVVIMVMRREGTVALRLVVLYMAGTLAGVPVAALLATMTAGTRFGHAVVATLAAALGRVGFAVNAAFGYLAFTVFLIMIIELARGNTAPALPLVMTRLYDVFVGCVISLVAILLASLAHRPVDAAAAD